MAKQFLAVLTSLSIFLVGLPAHTASSSTLPPERVAYCTLIFGKALGKSRDVVKNFMDLLWGRKVKPEDFDRRSTFDFPKNLDLNFNGAGSQNLDYSNVEWKLSDSIDAARAEAISVFRQVLKWQYDEYRKWASTNANYTEPLNEGDQLMAFLKYLNRQSTEVERSKFFKIAPTFIDTTVLFGDNAIQFVRTQDDKFILRLRLYRNGNESNQSIVSRVGYQTLFRSPLINVEITPKIEAQDETPGETAEGLETLLLYLEGVSKRLTIVSANSLLQNLETQIRERFSQAFILKNVVEPVSEESLALNSLVAKSSIQEFSAQHGLSFGKVSDFRNFILGRLPTLNSNPGFATAFLSSREAFVRGLDKLAKEIVGLPQSLVFDDQVSFSVNGNIQVVISIFAEAQGVLQADGTVRLTALKIPGPKIKRRKILGAYLESPHIKVSVGPKAGGTSPPTQDQLRQVLSAFQ